MDHGLYVWEEFVSKSAARHVAIVAHSYGGVVTVELVSRAEVVVYIMFVCLFVLVAMRILI